MTSDRGVEAVLDGEGHDVVLGAQELGHLEGCLVVRGAGQADGEGVQLRQVRHGRQLIVVVDADQALAPVEVLGPLLAVAVHAHVPVAVGRQRHAAEPLGLALGNRRHQARVQAAGEQDAVGNLGHQPFPDRLLKRLAQQLQIQRRGGHARGGPTRSAGNTGSAGPSRCRRCGRVGRPRSGRTRGAGT